MLTEKQAWEVISKAFAQAILGTCGIYWAQIGDIKETCVCYAIEALENQLLISECVGDAMRAHMEEHNGPSAGFWWPRSMPEGAAARAEFCKKMAEECVE